MLRRTALVAKANITDWSTITSRVADNAVGRCFDPTVFESGVIPTNHFQDSLFRLPIPKLEDTCKRYTAAVQPLVSDADFQRSKSYIDAFEKGVGKQLQESLVAKDKANPRASFISEDWFDLYLRDRSPLPINYNPLLVARYDSDKKDPLVRAAFWAASTARWSALYRSNTLKPEVFYFGGKSHYCRSAWFQRLASLTPRAFATPVMAIGSKFHAFPLDMSQYGNLHYSTRVPGADVDTIVGAGFARHMLVNYRGNQYRVDIATAAGEPLPEATIYARLRHIVARDDPEAKTDVGVFTSMERREWAGIRAEMARDTTNAASFKAVDSAMFVLDLDLDFRADFMTQAGSIAANRRLLAYHKNRWWDKSVSVIVTGDAALGVNFEHAWGDGVAVLRYTVDCFNDTCGRKAGSNFAASAPTETGGGVELLQWTLTPDMRAAAERAEKRFVAEIDRMDYTVCICEKFGNTNKELFSGDFRADPFMQLAMQVAWWRLNNTTVSTYESASTAAYNRGRTECIRSATVESQRFTAAFDKKDVSAADKLALLAAASKKHTAITSEAKMGKGIDRHLFALKKVAERSGAGALPEIFTDPAYTTLGSNIISTSSLFSEALLGGGFGPVSPGYGVGYAAAPDVIQFNVSCWKSGGGPKHSANDFAAAVYEAVDDMSALILSAEKKGAK